MSNYIKFKDEELTKNTAFSHNEESVRKNTNKKIPKKKVNDCVLLLLGIFLCSYIFLLSCFIHFYIPSNHKSVFKHIKLNSAYDMDRLDHLLPIVSLELKNKNIHFEHRVLSAATANLQKEKGKGFDMITQISSLFKSISNYNIVEFDSEKGTQMKLKQQRNKFEFKVHKVPQSPSNHKPEQEKIKKDDDHKHKDDEISCYNISVKLENDRQRRKQNDEIEVCYNLGGNSWFGGHESLNQPYWPLNNQSFDYVPYVTGFSDDWSGVVEAYWLSSNGVAIFVDDDMPLFVKHTDPNQICLKSAKDSSPYKFTPVYKEIELKYVMCVGPNIRDLHIYMSKTYRSQPQNRVDFKMMQYPIFTTWSYFFKDINQKIVLDYARQIYEHNYTISQLEIDDKWEKSYGDLDFDQAKFPDVNAMTNAMHAMDMRITLWVHPFVNIDSFNFVNGTKNGYWIKDTKGKFPAFTSWWDGDTAAIVDTTNPFAVSYYTNKLNILKSNFNIDSFKFDAGEAHWLSGEFKFFNNQSRPNEYSQNYVKLALNQNNFVEARVGHRNQQYGIFYRILDRASDWTIHDGLKSVVTATLHFSLSGYPFVLPDIIGGNGDISGQKELFIRWTQLTAFLPAMQFGVPPWTFDDETEIIAHRFVKIHTDFVAPYINSFPLSNLPIIRPIWWAEPLNSATFNISDQFLVGDEILVAPILDSGLKSRSVYFPAGTWYNLDDHCYYQGPKTITQNVALSTIPFYYSRQFLDMFKIDSKFLAC